MYKIGRILALTLSTGLCAAIDARAQSLFSLDTSLRPQQATTRAGRQVAASTDASGVQTDFVEGLIGLTFENPRQLQQLTSLYRGRVIRTGEISTAAAARFQLSNRGTRPLTYILEVRLSRAPLDRLENNARLVGMSEPVRVSSEGALRTAAILLDAKRRGFKVTGIAMSHYDAVGPRALFSTTEGPLGSGTYDAFQERRYGAGNNGSFSNVIPAWQFLLAHGYERRVRLAVIDSGFWLRPDGTPMESDTDFPVALPQLDMQDGDAIADGANNGKCGEDRCDWHGTGVASVATGFLENGQARAGSGGLISDLIVIKKDDDYQSTIDSIGAAFRAGADVINISSGTECNYFCRQWYVNPIVSDNVRLGSKTIVVAAAGNENWNVGDPTNYRPCTLAYVICVGALDNDVLFKAGYSNYGERVDVFAPTNIPWMKSPPMIPPGAVAYQDPLGGTSAAAPLVAGVVAMMKAINPQLDATQVAEILRRTARPGLPRPGTTTPVANRVLDALAAVRAAAVNIPMTPDRLEPKTIDMTGQTHRAEKDLNIDATDVDSVRIHPLRASTVTVSLQFPKDLAPITLNRVDDESDECPASIIGTASDVVPTITGVNSPPVANEYRLDRTYILRVSGGTHTSYLSAPGINAYNLDVSIAPAIIKADSREPNDSAAAARPFGLTPMGWTDAQDVATLHSVSALAKPDTDFYLVSGVAGPSFSKAVQGVEINSFPVFEVFGNESPITLQAFRRNADGSLGPQLGPTLSADACTKRLSLRLEAAQMYFIKITGEPGQYTMRLGTSISVHRLNYENLEQLPTHPGPVEIFKEKVFMIPADPTVQTIIARNDGVQLDVLSPANGEVLVRGDVTQGLTRVSLAQLDRSQPYLLRLRRTSGLIVPHGSHTAPSISNPRYPVHLDYEFTPIRRTSENLIVAGAGSIRLGSEWIRATTHGAVKATVTVAACSGGVLRLRFVDEAGAVLGALPLLVPSRAQLQSLHDSAGRVPDHFSTSVTLPANTSEVRIEPEGVALPACTEFSLTEYRR